MTMNSEMAVKLRKSLIAHEGLRKYPYTDSVGKVTLGIGFNATDRGMTDEWINTQYQQDVEYFYTQLSEFAWYQELNDDRKIVLIDMAFMGLKRFLEFADMIDALKRHDYVTAAHEMLNSTWAEEVHGRAQQLADAMRSGVYNI